MEKGIPKVTLWTQSVDRRTPGETGESGLVVRYLASGETAKQQENSPKVCPKGANFDKNGPPIRYKIHEKSRLGRGCDFGAFWAKSLCQNRPKTSQNRPRERKRRFLKKSSFCCSKSMIFEGRALPKSTKICKKAVKKRSQKKDVVPRAIFTDFSRFSGPFLGAKIVKKGIPKWGEKIECKTESRISGTRPVPRSRGSLVA